MITQKVVHETRFLKIGDLKFKKKPKIQIGHLQLSRWSSVLVGLIKPSGAAFMVPRRYNRKNNKRKRTCGLVYLWREEVNGRVKSTPCSSLNP